MNIRKNIDYSEMYEQLDNLMLQQLPQMVLYCEIGKVVCRRTEKGAAVMASEYLNKQYPDVKGFSPRSLRRMRDFYRTYENNPGALSRAMQLGWIQNIVIMEADLTTDLREWYIKAAKQFEWSKTELTKQIDAEAYNNMVLVIEEYDNENQKGIAINICRALFVDRFMRLLRRNPIILNRENGVDSCPTTVQKIHCYGRWRLKLGNALFI